MDELRIPGAERAVLTAAAAGRAPAPPAANSGRVSGDNSVPAKPAEVKAEQAPKRTAPAGNPLPPLVQSNARIRLDETLNRPIVQIMDQENHVIRQYPPEALVQSSLKAHEMQVRMFDKHG